MRWRRPGLIMEAKGEKAGMMFLKLRAKPETAGVRTVRRILFGRDAGGTRAEKFGICPECGRKKDRA